MADTEYIESAAADVVTDRALLSRIIRGCVPGADRQTDAELEGLMPEDLNMRTEAADGAVFAHVSFPLSLPDGPEAVSVGLMLGSGAELQESADRRAVVSMMQLIDRYTELFLAGAKACSVWIVKDAGGVQNTVRRYGTAMRINHGPLQAVPEYADPGEAFVFRLGSPQLAPADRPLLGFLDTLFADGMAAGTKAVALQNDYGFRISSRLAHGLQALV